jgi:hypothetical protein
MLAKTPSDRNALALSATESKIIPARILSTTGTAHRDIKPPRPFIRRKFWGQSHGDDLLY